jgi:adenosylmethionine-8-amino-7-oxononanoate aminotransferase
LRDVHGREYLDANASIWTNLHGHNHPKINAAIRCQLRKIAHSSALGLANEPASLLAEKIIESANPTCFSPRGGQASSPAQILSGDCGFRYEGRERQKWPGSSIENQKSKIKNQKSDSLGALADYPQPRLTKVFFSDDGATAMEVAIKLAYEFTRRSGRSQHPKFLSLQGAYHGDTIGAASLGHIDLFRHRYAGLLFKTDTVMAPYCYRCPFNRATPKRADAREYRCCRWECVDRVQKKIEIQRKRGNPYAALVFEPLIQGAAGMIPQPAGWLSRVAELVQSDGALLIADEVMTGFGRTGSAESALRNPQSAILFACHYEGVQPDLLAVAKGLTGGYLPMSATLTTQAIFESFLGDYAEFKTFFHGHSYTAIQLGAAAGLANLQLLQSVPSIRARQRLEQTLRESLQNLWTLPNVGDIRQVGLIAGVELVKDWRTRQPFDLRERVGIRVCEAMAQRGVLTRPIGNVIVLMPPYCTSAKQTQQVVQALNDSIVELQADL